MNNFFELLRDFYIDVLSKLGSCYFTVGTMTVSLLNLLFAFMVVGLIISVFWRGAKT